MAFSIQDLINPAMPLVTVRPDESCDHALQRMIDHDFTQLPVVDALNRPLGLLSRASLLRAMHKFSVPVRELRVLDAMEGARSFRPGDDPFDLLDELQSSYAILVTDHEHKLRGIVTSYDTSEYFRRRTGDMILFEDIEQMLRTYICDEFVDDSGVPNIEAQQTAVRQRLFGGPGLRRPFESALREYLSIIGPPPAEPDREASKQAFLKHFREQPSDTTFDQLTLGQYIQLFLHADRWTELKQRGLQLEPGKLRPLLTAVGSMRNKFFHFRAQVSPQQRDDLIFVKEWLQRNESTFIRPPPPKEARPQIDVAPPLPENPESTEFVPAESDDSEIRESRYFELGRWLDQLPASQTEVQLSFSEIERIIDGDLPRSARLHRSWWANDGTSHVQSQQWLNRGWRVSAVNFERQHALFQRMTERAAAYRSFFTGLIKRLIEAKVIPGPGPTAPDRNWLTLDRVTDGGTSAGTLVCAFTSSKKFRIELYLDSGDLSQNKARFEKLFLSRDTFESTLGGKLSWERLPERRASRIALYSDGFITDPEEGLDSLREWAVEMYPRFRSVVVAALAK